MPNPPTNRLDIFEKNQYNLEEAARKSRAWFSQQVLLLSKQRISPNRIMADGSESTLTPNIIPGNLYMYFYDPKLKQKLPYYDRFPMVLPFRKVEDGFIGLNLHYLPYQFRVILMRNLTSLANNQKMDKTTRIKMSWQILENASKFNFAKPCVKQYLLAHVRSPFKLILPKDWGTAMMLPVERFAKADKETVWKDSRKKI